MNIIKMTSELSDRLSDLAHRIEMVNDDSWYILRDMFETAQVQPTEDVPEEITKLLEIRELLADAYDMLITLASPF